MQALLARLALGLLIFGAGHALAREVVAPKATVSPAAKVKVAPHGLPANATLSSKPTAQERTYSDLVDHVSKTMDDFTDDNTSGNQGRDHLGDPPSDASKGDADGKAPDAARKGKRP